MADPIGIALVGLGKHAVRTVIPALERCTATQLRRIVVRDHGKAANCHPELASLVTDDFEAAIADPSVSAVYVATPLAAHGAYASMALAAGKHLWCEKPVSPTLAEAEALSKQASDACVAIFEIDYFQHHQQFLTLKNELAGRIAAGQQMISAEAVFTIPELPPGDIRYSLDLCGGALYDVGYYPLSAAIALFGAPVSVSAISRNDPQRGVDLNGSALLGYGGFAVHAQWAIGASYRSDLTISMSSSRLHAGRAFAKPAEVVSSINVFSAFGANEPPLETGADDAFVAMLDSHCAAIFEGSAEAFAKARQAIADRARLTERVRSAAESGQRSAGS